MDNQLAKHCTEDCRMVEGAEAYTVVIILAIVQVYTDSHNTMATTVYRFSSLNQPANLCIGFSNFKVVVVR
jgi:hypothetical protein